MAEYIGGINPVLETLKARGRTVQRLYVAQGRGGAALNPILELAGNLGLKVQRVDRSQLDRLFGRTSHQGVVAQVGPYPYFEFEDLLDRTQGTKALLLVLDGVQDPMNLGSLIRSAEAAGADGLIIPREKAAPVTAAAMKAAAGAAEFLPVARVVNLPRTLDQLKEAGFWVTGADAGAQTSLFDFDPPPKTALVLGGEGKGLGRLVREHCDVLVSIPMAGRVPSLNASVAGALVLFEYVRRYRKWTTGPDQ